MRNDADHQPRGYRDWLREQEPIIPWDDAGHRPKLETEADWIKAGEIVFDAPVLFFLVSPNTVDAFATRGRRVFEDEGCDRCHTPPLCTNNKLNPAPGFAVPDDHLRKLDILPRSVRTDPTLTLTTRRGTGYYKVPALKGVLSGTSSIAAVASISANAHLRSSTKLRRSQLVGRFSYFDMPDISGLLRGMRR